MNKRFLLIGLCMAVGLLLTMIVAAQAQIAASTSSKMENTVPVVNFSPGASFAQEALNVVLDGQIGGTATAVALQGQYAYIGNGSRLTIQDISNPAAPVFVGQTDPLPGAVKGVAVAGNYAYVAAFINGLRVIDIANPAAPSEVGFFMTTGNPQNVAVAGNYVYLVDLFNGLHIIDVSVPTAPNEVGFFDTPGEPQDVAVVGSTAYVADGSSGLRIIDVSVPTAPVESGSFDTTDEARGVATAGNYAYVADGFSGLRLINVSVPAAAFEAGFYDTPGQALDVAVADGYAYVADSFSGLRVIAVSNPAAAFETGFYDTPGEARSIAVTGLQAYVADSDALLLLRFVPPVLTPNVWTHGGPYGGVIDNVVLHPVTPTILYAAAWGSGIFATDNSAGEWYPSLITPIPERPSIDPFNPQWLYSGSANRCLRSRDGGATWDEGCTPASAPTWQYPFRFRPVTHPAIAGRVFLGLSVPDGPATAGHLYRSSDGGDYWLDLTPNLPQVDTNVTAITFDPLNTARIIVGTRDGYVYVSTNGGEAWTQAARPDTHIERLAVNPFGAHEVWAVTGGTDWGAPHLWRSTDAALTQWEQVIQASSLTFHPTISGTIWAASGGGYASIDGGQNWDPVGGGLTDVLDFAIDPQNPDTVYAGTMRGVYKSNDNGQTWAEAFTGLSGVLPNLGLAVSPINPDEVYAAANGRVFRSLTGGQAWDELTTPQIAEARPHMRLLAVDPAMPTRIYLGDSHAFAVHLSDDKGQSWLTAVLPLPPGATDGGIWCVTPHPTIPGRVLVGAGLYGTPGQYPGALYLSQNYGESWSRINTGSISGVAAVVFDPASPQIGYAGTEGGGMLKSTDGGTSWQPLTTWTSGDNVLAVAVHPTNHKVFVSTMSAGQGIFVSADGGQSWNRLAEQPTTGPVWELLFTQGALPVLYAGGMESGLSFSTDEGSSWSITPGLPAMANVPSLASVVVGDQAVLYVGTSGGAVTPEGNANRWIAAPVVLGSGVYRQVQAAPNRVYLPLTIRS